MKKSIEVFAPATVANVGCGFDIFGFAVDRPGDRVRVTLTDTAKIEIRKITGDGGQLPREVDRNTAGVAILNYLEKVDYSGGLEIELIKGLPLGSGMGSSAASAVASVVAVNTLLDSPLHREDLLPFVMAAEKTACGTAHADNAAPALLGGFFLIRSYQPLDIVRLPVPDWLYCVLIHPNIEIRTAEARAILPEKVPLSSAISQWGNTAALAAALYRDDPELLGRALQDAIVEPVRSRLIPHFEQAQSAALTAGALGCSISGSGPSLFALCRDQNTADEVAEIVKNVYIKNRIRCESYVSQINREGPRILG